MSDNTLEIVRLLTQIAEQTQSNSLTTWIVPFTGMMGVIVSGISAFLVFLNGQKQAKNVQKQIEANTKSEEDKLRLEEIRLRANIITTERIRWLQELRSRGANFYALLDMYYNLLKRPINPQLDPSFHAKGDEIAQIVMRECNQILLLLNPNKKYQAKLEKKCNEALKLVLQCVKERNENNFEFNDNNYSQIKKDFFDSLINIGIETWEQIIKFD